MQVLGNAGASRVKVVLDEGGRGGGIDANSETVRNGVDYAAQGGGSLTAKAQNGDKFDSTNDVKTATLPTSSADRTAGLKALTKWFQQLLGREQDDSLDNPAGDDDGSPRR